MKYKIETITIFVLFLVALISFPKFTGAQETIQRKVEKATLQIHIEYSDTGDASLIVKKIKSETYEPEEMARLLSHWFSKILYLLQSPMPQMFLIKEVNYSLFEPKIKPRDNVLKKAQIDDVVKLVRSIKKENLVSTVSLYLQQLPNGKRGIVSYFTGNITEQQTVFSWLIILQYASQKYSKKDILFIHDIMGETVKAYSGGADYDNLQNTVIIPNNAYSKIKKKN